MQYIGITGFNTANQTNILSNLFKDLFGDTNPDLKLMVGILVSNLTLTGQNNRNRYPDIHHIKEILSVSEDHLLKLIHYSTSDLENISNQLTALSQIDNRFDGFQLNLTRIDRSTIASIRSYFPTKRTILQINNRYLNDLAEHRQIFNHILIEDKSVDGIIIDPSGDRGELFDNRKMVQNINFFHNNYPKIPITISGGLCGDNLITSISPLLRQYGQDKISIDAEGRLRNDSDWIIMDEAEKYLKRSAQIFKN